MKLLDGTVIAADIKRHVKEEAGQLKSRGITPRLAVVVATDDGGALWYVNSIQKVAKECDIDVRIVSLGSGVEADAIARALDDLAADETVHGIILQTPLPPNVNADMLISHIPVHKDIDGANPLSLGNLLCGLPAFGPATAVSVMKILEYYGVAVEGKRVVVVGRSRVVGKPVALLLLEKNATVIICHSKTVDLATHVQNADIVVAAVGHPHLITSNMVKPDATIIDVGTTVDAGGNLVGDVDSEVSEKVHAMTPVPGGVGPVTTALILQHTLISVDQTNV